MTDRHSDILGEVLAEEAQLARWKRLALALGLVLTVSILLLSWWVRTPGDAFIAYVYPVMAGLFTLLLMVILATDMSLKRLAVMAFLLAAGLILVRLTWHYHFSVPLDQSLLLLVGAHYWSVGAIIVASFLVFDRYQGLLSAAVILLIASVIAVSGLLREPVSTEVLAYLLRVHLFLAALLVMSSVMSITREYQQRAQLRTTVLDRWANSDQLTGLANRRAMDRVLRARLSEAQRHQRPLCLILLDLDHFKQVNDAYGHLRGDEVLVALGKRLTQCLRVSDTLARWGGEEFLIVAPETTLSEALVLAERCRAALAAAPLQGVAVTATFGVSELMPGDSVESLVARADLALYQGKQRGRNRVELQDSEAFASGGQFNVQ